MDLGASFSLCHLHFRLPLFYIFTEKAKNTIYFTALKLFKLPAEFQ